MVSVALKTWVVDGDDRLVAGQVLSNLLSGGGGLSNTQVQGLQTSVSQPGVEGRRDRANGVLQEAEFVVQLRRVGGQNTTDNIRVAVDVLGDRVNNHIGAVGQWVGNVWRQERVVDGQDHRRVVLLVPALNDAGNIANVSDRQGWVRWGLQPHEGSLWSQGRLQVLGQVLDERGLNAVGVADLGEVSMGATVHVTARDDVRSDLQGLNDQGGGSRARRQGNSIAGLLQRGDSQLEVVSVWVGRTRVLVDSKRLGWLALGERGGKRDWFNNGTSVWVKRSASVDGVGSEPVVGSLVDGHCEDV